MVPAYPDRTPARGRSRLRAFALAGSLAVLASSSGAMGATTEPDSDLTELSIEDLLDLKVTIASRKTERLRQVPGAVYVITGDEIRRAGHTSIQEALRMVPGFYVSRWQTSNWDVTSRGFGPGIAYTNLAYINQLLVLIDGVVVYTPQFPGVWWALQDIDVNDIDRIEVIRGPGGILWGTNAVHGVVHVITKDARETVGPRVSARTSEDERHVAARSGAPLGKDGAIRFWVKGADYETLANPFLGIDQGYGIDSTGFRADWSEEDGTSWMAWGRGYDAGIHEIGFDLTTFDPIRVLSRKRGYQAHVERRNDAAGSSWQASYSVDQQTVPTFFDLRIDVLDLDYRRTAYQGERFDLEVGGGWRHVQDQFLGADPTYLDFSPHQASLDTLHGYALGTYSFSDPRWKLVGGFSLEHNDFTGWEVQPTLRLSWAPDDQTLIWGALSRAVRTPSLEERFSSQTGYLTGDPNFRSEKAVEAELGARSRFGERLSADVALYLGEFDDLRVEVLDSSRGVVVLTNDGAGSSYGAELGVDYKPTDRWSLRSSYGFHKGDFEYVPAKIDLQTDQESPHHAGSLRSYYDLGEHWELDSAVYVVEGLGDFLNKAEYVRVDVRVGWRPSPVWNAYLGVQGLNGDWSELDQYDTRRSTLYFGFDWTP